MTGEHGLLVTIGCALALVGTAAIALTIRTWTDGRRAKRSNREMNKREKP